MPEVQGRVEAGFEGVKEAFAAAQALDAGGAQLCVYRHGEIIVDLCAGRDGAHDRPYSSDLITVLMSCTKAATALCALILIERGKLDPRTPVSRYWPAFAAAGKQAITTAQLLSHTSGLAAFDPGANIGPREMIDWDRATGALADMSPLWPPGSACFYHFVTFGFLVGEVVRRIDGRTLGRFFAEEIAAPLGLDMWIGLPAEQIHRVAPHFRAAPAPTGAQLRAFFTGIGLDPAERLVGALIGAMTSTDALIEAMTAPDFLAAEVPAGNGVGDARSLARMYAACIGEVGSVRLISPATVDLARTPRTDDIPAPGSLARLVSGSRHRFGLGFELPRGTLPMLGPGSFGHPGAGGRLAFADPESGVAAAYVCNAMTWDNVNADPRWAWSEALREAITSRPN